MTIREKFERLTFQCLIHYSRHAMSEQLVEDNLVIMHRVGHNATHDFWIGLTPDDRLVYMSVCEDSDGVMADEHLRVFPKGEYPSYIGHW